VHIAILTFEGYNELDSLVALSIVNRAKRPAWRVSIACPTARVHSMNGVVIESQATSEEASAADAVIVGSGAQTREVVANKDLMSRLHLGPSRQQWRLKVPPRSSLQSSDYWRGSRLELTSL
jgi:hypothetical protein